MINFYIFKYIFLNRYRRLTYLDSGPFYFFGLLYLVSLYQLCFWKSEFANWIILFISFLQNISFLQREDFPFFRKQKGLIRGISIIILDLLLLSLPLLLIAFFKDTSFFIVEILSILILPHILILKKRSRSFINIFSSKDALWSTYARKKPWGFALLLIMYYIEFQAVKINNYGLFYIASCGILLFTLNVYTEKESLIYLKLSDKNLKEHLLNLLLINIKHIFYVSIPSFLIVCFCGIENIVSILLISISGSLLFWIRYIYADNSFLKNFVGMIFIILIASIYNIQDRYFFFLFILLINVLFLNLTVKKLKSILNKIKE